MPMSDYQRNHYRVLGVEADATRDEIRRAYRRLAKAHHPDVSGDPDSAARFREVNEAYRVLTDPDLRSKYDGELLARAEYTLHEREKRVRFEQWQQAQGRGDALSRAVARAKNSIRRLLGL